MEDDVCYSTIVFSTSSPAAPKDIAVSENVVYSEIKTTREKSIQSSPAEAEEVATSRYVSYRQTSAALGILCLLLLAGLTTICALHIKQISKYTSVVALYTNMSIAHMLLQVDKATLETEKEELTAQRDQIKNTIRLITQFSNFPVNNYCTSTSEAPEDVYCEPCMKNWIQNGSSCYLFYKDHNWISWADSQKYCVEKGGHLVVIDSIEEQMDIHTFDFGKQKIGVSSLKVCSEYGGKCSCIIPVRSQGCGAVLTLQEKIEFISQHIPYYYDKYHGYWIGLSKQYHSWIWTTGAKLQNISFWTAPPQGSHPTCVLLNPNSAGLNNWEGHQCSMRNRFICEMKDIVWPRQM